MKDRKLMTEKKHFKNVFMIIAFAFLLLTLAFPVSANAAVKLNKTKITICKNESYKLKVTGTRKKVKWSSSNKRIAKVNSKGLVKAVKKGKCKIYAKVGKKKLVCSVSVKNAMSISYSGNASSGKYASLSIILDLSDTSIYPPNGLYEIQCGNNNSYVLDIQGNTAKDNAALIIYPRHNGDNQRFEIKKLSNGYFTLKAKNSGKYLRVAASSLLSNKVYQSTETNNYAQWSFTSAGNGTDGYYYIRNRANGKYLTNANGSVKSSNSVQTAKYSGAYSQKWRCALKISATNTSSVTLPVTNTLSLTNYSSPTSIEYASEFTVKGTISSAYNLQKVTIGIWDSSSKAVSTYSVVPNSKSYNISNISSKIHFSYAKPGTNYFKIWAYNGKQSKYLLNKAFTVKEPPFVSITEIDSAASKYGISTSSNAYKALLSINTKYANQIKDNWSGINIFLFEGVGNNADINKRENAMCVVVNNKKITYINRNSSSLPDHPFIPEKNYSTDKNTKIKYKGNNMPTLISGIYKFETVNHNGKYAALKLKSLSGGGVPVLRYNYSDWTNGTSTGINVHRKSHDYLGPRTPIFDQSTWVNSAGCQNIGKTSEYPDFVKAVGIVNSTWTDGPYVWEKTGRFIVDRSYAASYMSSIGYSNDVINKIKNDSTITLILG